MRVRVRGRVMREDNLITLTCNNFNSEPSHEYVVMY